jgi:hypothetical protein
MEKVIMVKDGCGGKGSMKRVEVEGWIVKM